jgi:hypothetical protein
MARALNAISNTSAVALKKQFVFGAFMNPVLSLFRKNRIAGLCVDEWTYLLRKKTSVCADSLSRHYVCDF